ncbi:carbohydrate ABC transporter permease [Streptomyces turgidiscabies]|uniref:ABC transporter, permease protein n=1 Tax=Streptomyces turgidiscabies (strain Car8) TaxID=698760 RepID=L7F0V2_STRT8|nr:MULTISPECIES: sugar ABC transporter permease [Streptomyces]ELP65303.1 ABC transporter, permease protein [Streptomyces turgidiscabies Car8]MDX3491154.1 sugar ABC transporter permease [Streptomyces turgidiscabies]GAQ73006.1 lactose transport system permease protein LacF [Streptomyces turgidiscabies]
MVSQVLSTALTVLAGVAAALAVYWVLNKLAEALPGRWENRIKPYFYIAPAVAAIGVYLVYPTVVTVVDSLRNGDGSRFVGLDNFGDLLSTPAFRQTLLNSVLWIALVPAACIVVGLLVAALTDRLSPRAETAAKTIIFMPMAISAVGSATVWRFMYATQPAGTPQTGLLNGIVTAFGHDPVPWLQQSTLHANSMLLMVMLLWGQAGFSMVLLSAAIKGVPAETLEAARLDGAGEMRIFRRIIVPQIRGTLITVFVTVLITVMKIFDVIYVMTNGSFNTNVVGLEFFNQLYTNYNYGYASAIVVMLLVAIVPIMIYQIRHFRAEESA